MHFALRHCSRRTTRASPCGMVCLPREIIPSMRPSSWSSATPYGPQRRIVPDRCFFSNRVANCSEVYCVPSFSSKSRGLGSLVIFSMSRAVSSLMALVGSSLRDGFIVVRITDLLSLLVYSSTAGANCLCESEMQTMWSMGNIMSWKYVIARFH